jgi:hypothetical protein
MCATNCDASACFGILYEDTQFLIRLRSHESTADLV